jgi:uncharacterized protein YdaU (DUF1376 family)
MHYYPHHIGDYKSATAHLTNEEDLAYRRLLEMYYDTETFISLETQWVARRLRVGTQALESVLKDFFVPTEEGWKHSRCDLVIREYHEMAEKNRRNGRLGGRPKSSKQGNKNPVGSQSDASGNPVVTHSKANQEPITRTNNQEIKNTATVVATPNGVSSEVWGQFVKQRKSKKAQITNLVMAGIQREADKAGYTLEAALAEVVVRNWTSFKADWVLEKQTATQKAAANMALLTRGMSAPKTAQFWAKPATNDQNTLEVSNEPKRIL